MGARVRRYPVQCSALGGKELNRYNCIQDTLGYTFHVKINHNYCMTTIGSLLLGPALWNYVEHTRDIHSLELNNRKNGY